MAVEIPTLKEIRDGIISDLEGKLGVSIPAFGKNFLAILAGVIAAKQYIQYLAIQKVQNNVFPDLAETVDNGGTLERFGRVKLGRNRFPASNGLYTIDVTGTAGAVIPASTTWKSTATSTNPGKLFILDNEYTFAATGTEQVQVRTLEVGSGTRLEVGDEMTLTGPVTSVQNIAVVANEDQQPFDAESVEDYRAKIIEAFQLEPQGGASSDYRLWGKDAQGVQEIYAYAKSGESAVVNLYVEATIADSTDGRGTPSAALLEDVEEVVEFDPDTTKPLEERGRRPLGAFLINYLPITVKFIDVDFVNFTGLTSEIEATIETVIGDYLATVRPFVAGADVLADKNDELSVNDLTAVVIDAIPNTSSFDQLILKVDDVAVPRYLFLNGDIPSLDTIQYV